MKIDKNWDKVPEGKARMDRDHKRGPKNHKVKMTDNFQDSMREDMRGPMEKMDEVSAEQ